MLDATVVLQDVESLLDSHFSAIQAAWQAESTTEPTPAAAADPIADFVTNLFMAFMFSELETRLAR